MTRRRYAHVVWCGRPRWLAVSDDGAAEVLATNPGDGIEVSEARLAAADLAGLQWLPPCAPQKIIGLGYNYKSLVGPRDSYEEPVVFLKSPTSLCGHGARVPYPPFATKVWVEVELALVIGRECRNVSPEDAIDCILGCTIGSDVTAENIHGRDWHLARSKAIDGFAPTGPFLVTGLETRDLSLRTMINGHLYQRGNTGDRIQDDSQIVSNLSRYFTLKPGDLVLTGTPAGALDAVVQRGDVVTHQIDGLGELSFTIG